ncbi:hypothetical protein C0Q70_14280 [Pomacea canaliculata]|uniref:YesK-like protein n=2 Tax=Pomacea canaliculata TaxID=400727 RepID=A0A2T7NZN2_POMCA|nr:hypothetical protein C0Q70_14280 [Pomacea canaliculata]
MECIGLIAVLLAFLILLLYCFVNGCRRREALLATIFFIFGAVIAMVIGYIIFGTKYEGAGYEVGWSMGVAIAGTVLIFIAGIMSVLQHMGR